VTKFYLYNLKVFFKTIIHYFDAQTLIDLNGLYFILTNKLIKLINYCILYLILKSVYFSFIYFLYSIGMFVVSRQNDARRY